MKVILLFLLTFKTVQAKILFTEKSEGMHFSIEQIASGHEIIWGMSFLSKNLIIFTQKDGVIKKLNLKTKKVSTISGGPKVVDSGQGGLLDVRVAPNYPSFPWIYFTYSKQLKDSVATTLSRAQLKNDKLDKWQDLYSGKTNSATGYHFGSRVAFDGKGHVFFGMGDRGQRDEAQNLTNQNGTIIRLNMDGSIPKDNPFIADKNALPQTWSYGHRNPQGLVYDLKEQKLWEIEHGPRGGDEINLIEKGKNYGWPKISYGREYWSPAKVGEGTHKQGMEQPVKYYVPSIAPCGLEVYHGDAFPKWQGNLFSGALKLRHLNRVVIKDGKAIKEERLLEKLRTRIRNVIQGPDDFIYISTDDGRVLRLVPKKS